MPERRLSLIVIYTERFAQCRDFYAELGLEFAEEQHGSGPLHVAAELGDGTVLELYPAPAERSTGRLRLGLVVAPGPGRGPGATQVVDPDGRVVDLHVAAPETSASVTRDRDDERAPA